MPEPVKDRVRPDPPESVELTFTVCTQGLSHAIAMLPKMTFAVMLTVCAQPPDHVCVTAFSIGKPTLTVCVHGLLHAWLTAPEGVGVPAEVNASVAATHWFPAAVP